MGPEVPRENRDQAGLKQPATGVQTMGLDWRIGVGALILLAGGIGYLALKPSPTTALAPAPTTQTNDPVSAAEASVKQNGSPENYLNLSLAYSRARRFEDSLTAARKAIELRPDYAEAYNNEAAAFEDLHRWDEAIVAAQQALRLKPDFQLARNNLAYAMSQKAAGR